MIQKREILGEIMKKEETKKFELNTKVLENFDKIMATKLDEIEELKVTGLDKGSKLLNIISLCANVKTLILEGDPSLNSDKILNNMFKPEKLENLILNNAKLPTANALKRFQNLKKITLKEIRFCHVKDFLEGIANQEKIESIAIFNTDMANSSASIFEKFINLKYLTLNDVKNLQLDDLSFLDENSEICQIELINQRIPITQINHLLTCDCEKNVKLDVVDAKGKTIQNCKIEIVNGNNAVLNLPVQVLERILKRIDCKKIDSLFVILEKEENSANWIKSLKTFKKELHITLADFACLDAENAKKIKNILKLDKIEFSHGKNVDIITYIEIRTEMENVLHQLSDCETEAEKFLLIYKILGQDFQIVEKGNLDVKNKTCTTLQICELLQNCLKCIDISSYIITGEELENEKKHYWNDVQIEGKWYHVDLSLDAENIKKNSAEYCLLGDKNFLDNHIPKSGKNHYCADDFNPKLVNVFFKTGLFKENLWISYLEMMIEKIKKLLNFNKKQEILALPSGEKDKNNQN